MSYRKRTQERCAINHTILQSSSATVPYGYCKPLQTIACGARARAQMYAQRGRAESARARTGATRMARPFCPASDNSLFEDLAEPTSPRFVGRGRGEPEHLDVSPDDVIVEYFTVVNVLPAPVGRTSSAPQARSSSESLRARRSAIETQDLVRLLYCSATGRRIGTSLTSRLTRSHSGSST
jgi:hypothetical protein